MLITSSEKVTGLSKSVPLIFLGSLLPQKYLCIRMQCSCQYFESFGTETFVLAKIDKNFTTKILLYSNATLCQNVEATGEETFISVIEKFTWGHVQWNFILKTTCIFKCNVVLTF